MKPLLSGPVVVKPGVKLVDCAEFVGNKFSNVDEEGATAHVTGFKPANWALSALIFAVVRAWHAFTMLNWLFGSCAAVISTSDGIVITAGFVSVVRRPS